MSCWHPWGSWVLGAGYQASSIVCMPADAQPGTTPPMIAWFRRICQVSYVPACVVLLAGLMGEGI